jgi:peptidylprolyl isomerase
MKTHHLPVSTLLLALAALPLGAQTAAPAAVHHTATTAVHHTGTPGCVKTPEISSKIPALASDAPCARILYTLTRTPDTHLDYVSPLVSPDLRAALGGEKTTYSLTYVDTKLGTGALALPGKFYTVNYTGYLAADGTKFDSSLDPNREPISFPYGKHRVIEGWDSGFEGMRIGGKRRLYIPYELGYGDAGRAPVIPAKAVLIFDIEFIAQGDEAPKPKTPPTPPIHHPMTPPPAPAKPATPGSAATGTTTAPAATSTAPAATSTPKPQQ